MSKQEDIIPQIGDVWQGKINKEWTKEIIYIHSCSGAPISVIDQDLTTSDDALKLLESQPKGEQDG